jgi:DUF1009 family protein
MLQAGAGVLAIEAEKTIVLDQPEVVEFADRNKLVIVALPDRASPHDGGPPPAAQDHQS